MLPPRAVGEGVEALPYGMRGRGPELTNVGRNPSVTPLCGATAPLSGEPSRRSAYSTLIFSAVMSFIVGQLAMVIMYSSSARLVLA